MIYKNRRSKKFLFRSNINFVEHFLINLEIYKRYVCFRLSIIRNKKDNNKILQQIEENFK